MPSGAAQASDVTALLAALVRSDPGRPRVTWYGAEGERIELSGRTLENWVAKTANLLVEEFDAGPGTRVRIALPAHWRTTTWLLATWSVGGTVSVGPGPAPDVVVTADPARELGAGADAASVVAVALPALAASFGPGLPAGALDGAAEVRVRGDVFVPLVAPGPGDEAFLVEGGLPLSHADLLRAASVAARHEGWPHGVRLLTSAGPRAAVGHLLAPLVLDGSVVLHAPGLDAGTLARIAAQEQTTS